MKEGYRAVEASDARKSCIELVLDYAYKTNMHGADMDDMEVELGKRIDHAMCIALDIGKHAKEGT